MANFGAYLTQKSEPPFEDWWAFKMIDHDMKELSAQLLAMPGELPPMVARLTRILDRAIAERASCWESIA